MSMRGLKVFAAAAILSFALLAGGCSCSEPKPPKEKEVAVKIASLIPEKVELVSKAEDNTYTFRSQLRDLTFEVKPTADTLTLDGAVFGYSGKFNYRNNYWDQVYASYQGRIEKLIADHGFQIERKWKEDQPCISAVTIAASNRISEKEIDNINDFYRDLRDLAREEDKYHDVENDFALEVRFVWIDVWNDSTNYIYTKGNYNYSTKIRSATSDDELDVRKLRIDEFQSAKLPTPLSNGVLIVIEEDDAY